MSTMGVKARRPMKSSGLRPPGSMGRVDDRVFSSVYFHIPTSTIIRGGLSMVNLLFFGIFYKFFLPGINTYQRSEEVTAPFVIYVIIVGILTLAMIVYWNSSQKRKLAICTLIMILLCGSIMPIVYILVIVMFKFVGFLISSDPPKESYKRNPSADLIDFYQKQEDEKNEKKNVFVQGRKH